MQNASSTSKFSLKTNNGFGRICMISRSLHAYRLPQSSYSLMGQKIHLPGSLGEDKLHQKYIARSEMSGTASLCTTANCCNMQRVITWLHCRVMFKGSCQVFGPRFT